MALAEKKRAQLVSDLQPVLHEGEVVDDLTTGHAEVTRMGKKTSRRATVAITDRRVIIFSKKLGGYDVQDFAYGLLSSVDHKKGITLGSLDLRAAGDGIKVSQIDKREIERIAQSVRQRVAAAHSVSSQPHSAATPSSLADELKKLADLRDAGVLNEAEFSAQKAKLLG